MKKSYDTPTLEILVIAQSDVITMSGGRDYSGEWDTDW